MSELDLDAIDARRVEWHETGGTRYSLAYELVHHDVRVLIAEVERLRARIAELESRPVSTPPTPPGGRGGLRPEDIHGRNEVQLAGDLAVHDAHVGGDHAACDASWCAYATRSTSAAEAGIEGES